MNKPLLLTGAFVALTLLMPATGFSAAGMGPKAKIFAEFDANKNGVIDGDEITAVRKAYAADPKGQFARYDADHDGKLSDAEIAAIKPPGAKKAGEKSEKKGGKKKSAEAATETKPEQK